VTGLAIPAHAATLAKPLTSAAEARRQIRGNIVKSARKIALRHRVSRASRSCDCSDTRQGTGESTRSSLGPPVFGSRRSYECAM